jgi:hypothetical protein
VTIVNGFEYRLPLHINQSFTANSSRLPWRLRSVAKTILGHDFRKRRVPDPRGRLPAGWQAVPPQKIIETMVQRRQTISSIKVKRAQTVMATVAKTRHTSVVMTAKTTQKSRAHHSHEVAVCQSHCTWTTVATHREQNCTPHSAQRPWSK